jgi:hypothetical protein
VLAEPILHRRPVPRAALGWIVITTDILKVVPYLHRWQMLRGVGAARDAGERGDSLWYCVWVPLEVLNLEER